MLPEFQSSIPEAAEERIVERHPDGTKAQADYWLDGELVGRRFFFETGEPSLDFGLRRERYHGMWYRWDLPGMLISAIPYQDGLEHGTAHQWSFDGQLLGSYTMQHGTGLDLWWGQRSDGGRMLSEARFYRDGQRHGFEWWIEADQRSVYEEGHYAKGAPHGILRQWNRKRRLKRGYPQYYVNGERITKAQYLRACRNDSTLPPFQPADNLPARKFPAEVARHLGPAE
ncbi:MAG TPA: hypothetical protein VFZ66_17450 [Herpetosiphonaceae bacterium]